MLIIDSPELFKKVLVVKDTYELVANYNASPEIPLLLLNVQVLMVIDPSLLANTMPPYTLELLEVKVQSRTSDAYVTSNVTVVSTLTIEA